MKDFKYSSNNIKERRLELQKFLTVLLNENKLDKNICEYFIIASYNIRGIAQNIQSIERLQELNIGGGVLLSNLSYEEVPIESDSVIYCDPPYINTGSYLNPFNHDKFYEWLRDCREKN